MNIVCLSGELARERQEIAVSLPSGWRSMVLDVRREGDDDPGVVPVVLALPPTVVEARHLKELWPGRPILVVGKLEVDVDYASERPVAYHSVVAHRIELMPRDGDTFRALTPRVGIP